MGSALAAEQAFAAGAAASTGFGLWPCCVADASALGGIVLVAFVPWSCALLRGAAETHIRYTGIL